MKKKINWKKELMDFSFLAPSLILFLFIILVPLVRGVQYTFTNWDGLMPKLNYVGLKNYITVIHDKDLIQPICNTILFTLVTVVAINVIGLAVAMAVNKEFKGVNIIKSIIFIPLVVSLVLVSQMWMYVYSDFFSLLGWKSPLIDKKTSMLGLCIMSIWRESGLAMMIYLAGLKNIPTEINEAAIIDGANFWQRFRNVTVPFLAPAFTYCIPLWLAAGLRMYDYSFVATSGGPQHSTDTVMYYLYTNAFTLYRYGYANAVGVVLAIIIALFSVLQFKTMNTGVEY